MAHVVVLGGSGFVGRHIVAQLSEAGHRVVVPTRRRERAKHLILLPTVDVVEVNIHDAAALRRLLAGADAVCNLVGILHESGTDTFGRTHVELARSVVAAASAAGVRRLLHMSSLGAATDAPSQYLRSKGEAEAAVAASALAWTIFRPSVIFGRGDSFLSLFAALSRWVPVLALGSADARFQPIHVADVAQCFAHALRDDATIGQRYDLCGPRVYTLRELVRYVGELSGNARPIIGLSPALSRLQATVLEMLPGKLMTRDNLASMSSDSVCNCAFPPVFDVVPSALELVAPGYLAPDAAHGAYDRYRTGSGR